MVFGDLLPCCMLGCAERLGGCWLHVRCCLCVRDSDVPRQRFASGIRVAPSGLLPFCRTRPVGSLRAEILLLLLLLLLLLFYFFSLPLAQSHRLENCKLTLWLQSLFIPFRGTVIIFLHALTWLGLFSMFTVWYRLLSLVLMFSGLRIEALPHLQYRVSVYTLFLKRRTRKFYFRLLCTKPSKDKHKFFLSKVGSPSADLSANHATIVELSGPIYRLNMLSRQDFLADLSTKLHSKG